MLHRVLQRQIQRTTKADGSVDLDALLRLVSDVYADEERNRERSERANSVMARELSDTLEVRELAHRLEREKLVAERANVAKSQFLANMSHELRTPLNAIIGFSEIMLEDAVEDGRASDAADHEKILRAAGGLLHQINEILDFSKIEAGKLTIEQDEFSMSALVRDAIELVKPSADANGVTLSLELEDAQSATLGDAFRVNQCLLNLLSNAIKFSKGGAVHVRLHRVTEAGVASYRCDVADTGIGLSEEQLQRVFRPFEQADASTTRSFGGTGLGLAITRRLIDMMGGELLVESKLGNGSTFSIILPVTMPSNVAFAA